MYVSVTTRVKVIWHVCNVQTDLLRVYSEEGIFQISKLVQASIQHLCLIKYKTKGFFYSSVQKHREENN